jgi:hypothetical protein
LNRNAGNDWLKQRSIQTITIRARIVLMPQGIDWQEKEELVWPATWAMRHPIAGQNTLGLQVPKSHTILLK